MFSCCFLCCIKQQRQKFQLTVLCIVVFLLFFNCFFVWPEPILVDFSNNVIIMYDIVPRWLLLLGCLCLSIYVRQCSAEAFPTSLLSTCGIETSCDSGFSCQQSNKETQRQWHQLGHMQVCTLLQTDNHTSTPLLSFFTGRMPFLPPNQQRQSTEFLTKLE